MSTDRNQDKNTDDMRHDEDEFVRRARELLAAEADNLNAPLRSKLTQARHAALDEMPLESAGRTDGWLNWFSGRAGWAPTGAAVLVAVVAATWWTNLSGPSYPLVTQTVAAEDEISPDDFDMLLSDDGFELLADLDFYTWVEAELGDTNGSTG